MDDVKCHTFYIGGATWPDGSSLSLDGFVYENVHEASGRPDDATTLYVTLKGMLARASFTASEYAIAEGVFRQRGDVSQSDSIYIDGRDRAGLNGEWHDKVLSYLLRVVGYGRRAGRLMWVVFGFVVVGALIFKEESMVRVQKDTPTMAYNRLWYSLDLFAPAIDLGASKHWLPIRRWVGWYARIHRLAGWVVVPALVALALGILK
jgi:hypothetical protein